MTLAQREPRARLGSGGWGRVLAMPSVGGFAKPPQAGRCAIPIAALMESAGVQGKVFFFLLATPEAQDPLTGAEVGFYTQGQLVPALRCWVITPLPGVRGR